MNVDIWVPWLTGIDESGETEWSADMPYGVPWFTIYGGEPDLVGNSALVRGTTPHIVTRYCIKVNENHLPAVRKHLQFKNDDYQLFADGDETDILIVRLCREAARPEHVTDGSISDRCIEFFDAIPNIATANAKRKRDIKDVLLQSVARGLDPITADGIRRRHSLPSDRAQATVDAEIFDAAVGWVSRAFRSHNPDGSARPVSSVEASAVATNAIHRAKANGGLAHTG